MLFIGGLCFSEFTVVWAGIWTRALSVQEMNFIDCNPRDADIGYDEFEPFVPTIGDASCSSIEDL